MSRRAGGMMAGTRKKTDSGLSVTEKTPLGSKGEKPTGSRGLAHRGVSTPSPERGTRSFPIVGVGASAGDLEAFTLLLQNLPTDTGMAFVPDLSKSAVLT